MPVWPGDPPVSITKIADQNTYGYYLNKVSCCEHSGTHLGAPVHLLPGKSSVDQIPPQDLIGPAIKIDISLTCAHNRDYMLTDKDIQEWEARYGKLPQGHILLIETGWSAFWSNPVEYLGQNRGQLHFPGISRPAMEYLLRCHPRGIGIDSAGLDGGQSTDFAVNIMAAQNQIFHLENLTNLQALPVTGFTLFIGALSIVHGSGSPCRVLAQASD